MAYRASTSDSAAKNFWDRYIRNLKKQGINAKAVRWYVIRAEQYLKAFRDLKLRAHQPNEVQSYLEKVGRKPGLHDWQFEQIVDAVQKLFQLLEVDWLDRVDWEFWKRSAKSLSPNHPTLAREAPLEVDLPSEPMEGDTASAKSQQKEILLKLAKEIRRRNYSIRTEQAYVGWVARFIASYKNRSPEELGSSEVVAFLEYLAIRRNVSSSTQSQALNALVFLYDQVLQKPLGDLAAYTRPKRHRRLPVVLSPQEMTRLLSHLSGVHYLMTALMYGTGMRLMECVRSRVMDVDFDYREIIVRDGKGAKDRGLPLPAKLIDPVKDHMRAVRRLHDSDLEKGFGEVYLPNALARKYPNAPKEWGWQYVFPSGRLSVDPRTGKTRRHHINENGLQKSIKKTASAAAIDKRVTSHCMRHSFATHKLEAGYDIRTVQELLGHADVSTTMIYTHVLNRGGKGVVSPLDAF